MAVAPGALCWHLLLCLTCNTRQAHSVGSLPSSPFWLHGLLRWPYPAHGVWWQLHTDDSHSYDSSADLSAELETHRSICLLDKVTWMSNRDLNWTRPKWGSCFPTHAFPAPLPPFPVSVSGTSIHSTAQARNLGTILVSSRLTPLPTWTSSQVLSAWLSKWMPPKASTPSSLHCFLSGHPISHLAHSGRFLPSYQHPPLSPRMDSLHSGQSDFQTSYCISSLLKTISRLPVVPGHTRFLCLSWIYQALSCQEDFACAIPLSGVLLPPSLHSQLHGVQHVSNVPPQSSRLWPPKLKWPTLQFFRS